MLHKGQSSKLSCYFTLGIEYFRTSQKTGIAGNSYLPLNLPEREKSLSQVQTTGVVKTQYQKM